MLGLEMGVVNPSYPASLVVTPAAYTQTLENISVVAAMATHTPGPGSGELRGFQFR